MVAGLFGLSENGRARTSRKKSIKHCWLLCTGWDGGMEAEKAAAATELARIETELGLLWPHRFFSKLSTCGYLRSLKSIARYAFFDFQ